MKVLTAAQMREVDRQTMELGISGPILMENAGHRVVEYVAEKFSPLSNHRITVLCGKGNNGGDGFVIARQLWTRFRPASLHVVAVFGRDDSEPLRMLMATGCPVQEEIPAESSGSTLVIDAVLGTGITGSAHGKALEAIRAINTRFPLARVVAADVPSGMNSDSGDSEGEVARADATVTFTAPKLCHVLSPNCDRLGDLRVTAIGSPDSLTDDISLHLSGPAYFGHLLQPRKPDSNKGTYGHVLVVGGAEGKSGAAEMTGLSALRTGAGLVTVASSSSRLYTLELMTEKLPQTWEALEQTASRASVIAVGPGLGTSPEAVEMVHQAVSHARQAMVVDADGLNCLAKRDWHGQGVRVLTPHPGEMARLAGCTVAEVQSRRLDVARQYAEAHGCIVILKGYRTLTALPDGRVWVNPTGSPAMATGGTGDVLTGMVAAMLAIAPADPAASALAAVWLHGRSGELGAGELGEATLIATDLLKYLPEAMREAWNVSNRQ